jgi:hypothetical protein
MIKLSAAFPPGILGMKQSKNPVERREHRRLRAKEGTLAVFGRPRVTVGEIMDMSMGGLAFRYAAEDELSKEPCQLDILLADGLSHLYGLPCETVYDIETDDSTPVPVSSMVKRRRGVKFGRLTPSQKLHLENFIENHTEGEVEEIQPPPARTFRF